MLSVTTACASAPAAKPRAAAVESPPAELPYCPPAPQHIVHVPQARSSTSGTGAIQGVVRDQATLESVRDVTVVATSPALEGSASELTDAQGSYLITNLPPGNYEVVFYYGEIKIRQANVTVGDGKVTPVTIEMDTAATGGQVIDITQKAPTIDGDFGPGPRDPNDPHGGRLWAGRGMGIAQDYTKNIPLSGRADAPPGPPKCRPRPAEATPAP
jgi:hypothetical protein